MKKIVVILITVAALLAVIGFGAIYYWLVTLLIDPSERGTFGDLFGGLNAIFSGLAFAGVLIAILLQRLELKNQAKELQLQRNELEFTRHEFQSARITNAIYNQLEFVNERINNFEITIDARTYKKRVAIRKLSSKFIRQFDSASKLRTLVHEPILKSEEIDKAWESSQTILKMYELYHQAILPIMESCDLVLVLVKRFSLALKNTHNKNERPDILFIVTQNIGEEIYQIAEIFENLDEFFNNEYRTAYSILNNPENEQNNKSIIDEDIMNIINSMSGLALSINTNNKDGFDTQAS